MIIGIDPGLKGAIAFLSEHKYVHTLFIEDLPLKTIMGRKQVDPKALAKIVRDMQVKIKFAVIEDVASRPDDGVVSAFRFGFSTGILYGVLETLDIKILRVKPSVWKPALGLDSNKKKSLALAKKIWPLHGHYFARVKDDGRAEAALLAHFAKTSI